MIRVIRSAIDYRASRNIVRQALVAALFFAFVLQAQLAVGHYHFSINTALAQDIASESDGNVPARPSQAPCQTCQVVAGTQNYLPGAIAAFVPPLFVAAGIIDFSYTVFAGQAHDFIWRSRAPPAR